MKDEGLQKRKEAASSHEDKAAPPHKTFRKKIHSLPEAASLASAIAAGSTADLAKAITFIESNAAVYYQHGQKLLQLLSPETGRSVRIGITGVPGAGKSTFIESFGLMLCERGHRVAVLAVDPSSSISGGSILGDKTRMEELAKHSNAFIRPSPSGGTLGGVHGKTREAILLCEAAGFDVIVVETVGVGQSEYVVRNMVDFFMLLVLTGAGDELQGIKKGILEFADAVVINKADGINKLLAEQARREYDGFLHTIKPSTKGWHSKAYTCSALENKGIDELWKAIKSFQSSTKASGAWAERRRVQIKQWMHTLIAGELNRYFYDHPYVQTHLNEWEQRSMEGLVTPAEAAEVLCRSVFQNRE